jgi:hypothetical protein
MTHPFVSGFFDEIEKIALPALAAPLLGAGARSLGMAALQGGVSTLGGAAVNKAIQPKQPKPNKGFSFEKQANGMLAKAFTHPVAGPFAQGAAMTASGAVLGKMMEPRQKRRKQAPPPTDNTPGQFQYEQ